MSCLGAGLLAVSFPIRIHQSAPPLWAGQRAERGSPGGRSGRVQLVQNLIRGRQLGPKLHSAPRRIRCLFRGPSVFTESGGDAGSRGVFLNKGQGDRVQSLHLIYLLPLPGAGPARRWERRDATLSAARGRGRRTDRCVQVDLCESDRLYLHS